MSDRFFKWCQLVRHPRISVLGGLATAVLLAGIVGILPPLQLPPMGPMPG